MYGKGLLVYVFKCIVIFYIFKGIIGVKKNEWIFKKYFDNKFVFVNRKCYLKVIYLMCD